jgi:hypothetical protein
LPLTITLLNAAAQRSAPTNPRCLADVMPLFMIVNSRGERKFAAAATF